MPAPSQKPLVAKILALEPMTIGHLVFTDVGSVLDAMGDSLTAEEIVDAFKGAGMPVSVPTLYRWKADDGHK